MKLALLDKCTGCMACSNVCPINCISAQEDNEGFQQPIIDFNKCINCGKCTVSCPVLNKQIKMTKDRPIVYAVWNKDLDMLQRSTSGGAFGALANYVLTNNGVVYGAAYSDNLVVKHIKITSVDELTKLHGSKYVQSEIGFIYHSVKESLHENKIVLFSGTPCQIAGLYGFLGHDNYDNLITCDLVCHGVPSPGVYHKYLNFLEEKNGLKLVSINMRTKKRGWSSTLDMKHIYENNIIIETLDAFNDPFMNGFLHNLFLRKPCYECKYAKIPRESDITLADFWGIGNDVPFKHSTMNGISLVLINSTKGQDLFEQCKHSVFFEERSIEEAIKGNVMLSPRKHNNPLRANFFYDYQKLSFDILAKKYLKKKRSFKSRLKETIVKTIGKNNIKRVKKVLKLSEKDN